jgi:hypothetical protein
MNQRLRFGIFLAPFHKPGINPTLALQSDLELIQWLDRCGYVGIDGSGGKFGFLLRNQKATKQSRVKLTGCCASNGLRLAARSSH